MSLSLARSTLVYEWKRFLPGLLSVSFAGVLMLIQLGLLLGMFGTVTVLVDDSSADIWVTSPETKSFDQSRDIPESIAVLMQMHPELVHTETLQIHDADWRVGEDTRMGVTLVAMVPDADGLACPRSMRARLCRLLLNPGAVVVDASEADKLHAKIGGEAELDGRRVHVAAFSSGLRSIGNTYVFASQQTVRGIDDYGANNEPLVTFVLARLRAGAIGEHVRDDLQSLLRAKSQRVWTQRELSRESQLWWLYESGVGAGFLFSSLLGLMVGTVITSQSLRAAIIGSLREYATFRAIGVSSHQLAGVVLEQSAWIGALGAVMTVVISLLLKLAAQAAEVPLILTGTSVLAAAAITIATAVISGLLALRELYRVEPAELLR